MSLITNSVKTTSGYKNTNVDIATTVGVIGYTKSVSSSSGILDDNINYTGAGITLEPGLWSINVSARLNVTASKLWRIFVTNAPNSGAITSNITSIPAYVEWSNASGGIQVGATYNNLFKVTSNTSYYPGVYMFEPAVVPPDSYFTVDFYIWATRIG